MGRSFHTGHGTGSGSCTRESTRPRACRAGRLRLDGRLAWISDPVDGCRHDSAALQMSAVLDTLDPADWLGDKGYIGKGMITPIRKPACTDYRRPPALSTPPSPPSSACTSTPWLLNKPRCLAACCGPISMAELGFASDDPDDALDLILCDCPARIIGEPATLAILRYPELAGCKRASRTVERPGLASHVTFAPRRGSPGTRQGAGAFRDRPPGVGVR
jgi:hypothetical protein